MSDRIASFFALLLTLYVFYGIYTLIVNIPFPDIKQEEGKALVSFSIGNSNAQNRIEIATPEAIKYNNGGNSKAIQAVLDGGYTNPISGGPVLRLCGNEGNMFLSEYVYADNVNGKQVKLKVCCTMLGGCIIRH